MSLSRTSCEDAQEGPGLADRLDRAVRAEHVRKGVAAGGQAHLGRPAPVHVQRRVGDRAEAPVGALSQQRVVELPEDLRRGALLDAERAERVARQRGDRRGVGALPAHVPHDDAPPVRGVEHVVEVAADLGRPRPRRGSGRRPRRPGPRAARAAAGSPAACGRCSCARGTGASCRSPRRRAARAPRPPTGARGRSGGPIPTGGRSSSRAAARRCSSARRSATEGRGRRAARGSARRRPRRGRRRGRPPGRAPSRRRGTHAPRRAWRAGRSGTPLGAA